MKKSADKEKNKSIIAKSVKRSSSSKTAGTKKYVYFFGKGQADGQSDMKNFLGGKGANLAEMTNLGVPVPPGFTITTEVCTYYYQY
ncbi:MAG: PEP/pyruvate-binding domain-containing protein, partial [Thermodesulfobacteriota bacterium]